MKIEIEKPVVPKWFDDWYKDVPTEQDGYGATKEEHAIQLVSQVGWGNGLYKSMSNFEREHDEERVGYVLDNKKKLFHAILFGYEVEKEPLYYAKIKGWELLGVNHHWIYIKESKDFSVANVKFATDEMSKMTKEQWEEIGVNDTNADFERVE